jgi:hypothetical protein
MDILRTPDDRFRDLPDFPWEPQYVDVPVSDGAEVLRIAFVEAGPADGSAGMTEVKLAGATADVNPAEKELAPMFDDKSKKRRVTGPIEYAIDKKDETAWTNDIGPGRRRQRDPCLTARIGLAILGMTLAKIHPLPGRLRRLHRRGEKLIVLGDRWRRAECCRDGDHQHT